MFDSTSINTICALLASGLIVLSVKTVQAQIKRVGVRAVNAARERVLMKRIALFYMGKAEMPASPKDGEEIDANALRNCMAELFARASQVWGEPVSEALVQRVFPNAPRASLKCFLSNDHQLNAR